MSDSAEIVIGLTWQRFMSKAGTMNRSVPYVIPLSAVRRRRITRNAEPARHRLARDDRTACARGSCRPSGRAHQNPYFAPSMVSLAGGGVRVTGLP